MSVFLDFGTFVLWRGNTDRLKDANCRQVHMSECEQQSSGSALGNMTAPKAQQKCPIHPPVEGLQACMEQLHSHSIAQELINHSHETSSSTLVVLHGAQQSGQPRTACSRHFTWLVCLGATRLWSEGPPRWTDEPGCVLTVIYLRFNDSLINISFSETFHLFQWKNLNCYFTKAMKVEKIWSISKFVRIKELNTYKRSFLVLIFVFCSDLRINLVHISINRYCFPPTPPAPKMRLCLLVSISNTELPRFPLPWFIVSTTNEVFPLFAEILEIMASISLLIILLLMIFQTVFQRDYESLSKSNGQLLTGVIPLKSAALLFVIWSKVLELWPLLIYHSS